MLRIAKLLLLICCSLAPLAGCGRVVFRPQDQQQTVTLTAEQQQLFAQQQQELQRRADQLDADNQELETLLAQSRQQTQLLSKQVSATQGQLRATTERLAATQQDNDDLKSRTAALVASAQQPLENTIRPNSTLLRPIRLSNAPGVEVRQDGDVIRAALAADEVFYTASPQLMPRGEQLLRSVASELLQNYPGHLIGIEGHSDSSPTASSQFPTPHHLTVAQATSAYDSLQRVGIPAQQLFLIGHGANHPRVSNATEEGRKKNRRLELVVYPETVARR